MALIPALIKLAMSGRGGGGGGGRSYGGGYKGKGGYGGSRGGGRSPFDAQAYLDKEAGKDQLDDPFDMTQNMPNQKMWEHIFKTLAPAEAPAPPPLDPYKMSLED